MGVSVPLCRPMPIESVMLNWHKASQGLPATTPRQQPRVALPRVPPGLSGGAAIRLSSLAPPDPVVRYGRSRPGLWCTWTSRSWRASYARGTGSAAIGARRRIDHHDVLALASDAEAPFSAYTATSISRINMPAAFSTATSMYSRTASAMFARASSSVVPWDAQPGRPGTHGEPLFGLLKRHPVFHLRLQGSSRSGAVNQRLNLASIRSFAITGTHRRGREPSGGPVLHPGRSTPSRLAYFWKDPPRSPVRS